MAIVRGAKHEEYEAASVISELLCSRLQMVTDGFDNRDWLYSWERRALKWLLRYCERKNPKGLNAWTYDFMMLNKDAIHDPDGVMDYNLKAYNERKEGKNGETTDNGS